MLERALRFNLRHPWPAAAIAVLVAAIGGYAGSDLPVRLSIVDLLPSDKPIVREMREVSAEVGGVGYLGVVIGPADRPEQYLPAVAAALERRDDIRYAFYERESHSLRSKALYLLPREKFDRALAAARTLLMEGRSAAIDLGVDTESERAENREAAQNVLREIAGAQNDDRPERERRYFLSRDGRYAMLFAKPAFESGELGRSITLVDQSSAEIGGALPAGIPFRLWGRYVNQVRDTIQIRKDIAMTSILSVGLVVALLIFGLGTIRGALIAITCVILSMGWTAGFTKVAVGQINIVTGFMLAILGGLGVEYGIHLDRRYHQERSAGSSHEEAVATTYLYVGRALFSAAVTSAAAFFLLSTSSFRGFSELGAIAGFGVLSIYLVYMLMFPAASRLFSPKIRFPRAARAFGWYPFGSRWKWTLPLLAVLAVWGTTRAELEVDFSKMRKLSDETNELNDFVAELTAGRSTTPAALLTTSPERAAEVRNYLAESNFSPIDQVISLDQLVPNDMAERDRLLAPLRRRIAGISDRDLREKIGLDPELLRGWAQQRAYMRENLPAQISEAFGSSGSIVTLYTNDDLDRIPGLFRLTAVFDRVKAKFPEVKIGSDVPMLVAIVDYVFDDGILVLALFFLGSFVVLWLDFRSLGDALLLEAQLIAGMLMLTGMMGALGVPFTILNIAMIPAVLAAGIDMGVHVRHRERESTNGSLEAAKFVARGVQLGALTTLAGFGALFAADAQMLKGLAWVACLGQLAMYLVCMLIFPVARAHWTPLTSSPARWASRRFRSAAALVSRRYRA